MIGGFGVHDAAVSAFTMPRFRCSRCCEFRTHDRSGHRRGGSVPGSAATATTLAARSRSPITSWSARCLLVDAVAIAIAVAVNDHGGVVHAPTR
jgi:hypothetical protein